MCVYHIPIGDQIDGLPVAAGAAFYTAIQMCPFILLSPYAAPPERDSFYLRPAISVIEALLFR